MKFPAVCGLAAAIAVSGSQPVHEWPVTQLAAKQVSVNGTTIRYWEQGRGAPVVFVHGAISDHRTWESQREAVTKRYRYIALDRRYFGTAPWPDTGVRVSQTRDAADLAAFIRALEIEPAFVVGISGGANVALITAVRYPGVIRAVFVQEPGLRSVLTDSADVRLLQLGAPARDSARAAARAGNMTEAARLFVDNANGQPGSFDQLSPALKAMFVENARTLSLDAPPDEAVRCEQLRQIGVPVTITKGEQTKPISKVLADATHRCIPQSQLLTIPNASHGAPRQNPSAFNEALFDFLARHGGAAPEKSPGR
jgi:pimeloyl-ACP methyl ester carboxylesterase